LRLLWQWRILLPLWVAEMDVRLANTGITILGLAVLRLLWRWMNPTPELPATLRPYERFLARAVHFGLYAFIFLQPITGWIMSNAENYPVSYFGWFTLPDLVAPDKEFGEIMEEVHKAIFKGMLVLAVLHVAAALKHHFWLKDDVLKRMLPFGSTRAGSP
jgi:cytochrome b561